MIDTNTVIWIIIGLNILWLFISSVACYAGFRSGIRATALSTDRWMQFTEKFIKRS